MNWGQLGELLPVGVILTAALMVVLLDLVLAREERYILPMAALGGCLVALAVLAQNYFSVVEYFKAPPPWFAGFAPPQTGGYQVKILGGAFAVDGFGMGISALALLAGALSILCTSHEDTASALSTGEYYALLLLSVAGMMLLGYAHNFLTLMVSLEIMSVATYVLCGSRREDIQSTESALKYLILGAFSTAFLLLGIAFIYGATGSFSLDPAGLPVSRFLLLGGLGLLLVGVLFKVGAVPFHFWIPDVYQGAPTGITGLMAVGVKAAAFAVLARLAFETFANVFRADWSWLLMIAAVATMALGNLLAIHQKNVKRLLAYSAIAHTGYLLLAFLVTSKTSPAAMAEHLQAVFFYLLAYTFMTLGAFGVVSLQREDGRALSNLEDYSGLSQTHPAVALCMAVFMVSLAGLPPFAGFFAKFLVFRGAIEEGFVMPAVLGILTSVASLYYYLRVVMAMYMAPVGETTKDAEGQPSAAHGRPPWTAHVLIYGAGLLTLLLGLFPHWITAFYQ